MSTPNGGSLDDCITNLFALTELSGLQWRQYESPRWDYDSNPRTLLQSEPIFIAYSKLQTDGILSVWRRVPQRVIPPVFNEIPTLNASGPKELWVFWYGTTEPEEIENHCSELTKKKKGEDEVDDGTVNSIPYDVRCLLYKAWNTQLEKHYRTKKFLQVGRWFFRPHKFNDPSSAFIIDDYAIAYTHSFNIVGGNSMCMAVKPQLQPNLVLLAPFHLERNRKFKETKINVILAPWSIKGHISLRYAAMPVTKRDHEEVEIQLAQWKEVNLYADKKKKKKRRRDEGGETEGDDSEEDGGKGMSKMIRVQVEGGIRMWWPSAYVLVTLEETRKIARNRFPVADNIKSVPQKVQKFSKNRYTHLLSSEPSLRITQPVMDDVNFDKKEIKSMLEERLKAAAASKADKPPDEDLTVLYHTFKKVDILNKEKIKKEPKVVSYDRMIRRKVRKRAKMRKSIRLPPATEETQKELEETMMKKRKEMMTRERLIFLKGKRYNFRKKNGRPLNRRDTLLLMGETSCSSSEEEENGKKKNGKDDKEEEEEDDSDEDMRINISREMFMNVENASYHFDTAKAKREKKSNGRRDEVRLARSPFTPVRVLSPIAKNEELEQMARDIELEEFGQRGNRTAKEILKGCGTYFDVNLAGTPSTIEYKKYHNGRSRDGFREPVSIEEMKKANGKSKYDECSSDDGIGFHSCCRERELSPEVIKVIRPHIVPHFDVAHVGGVNEPPLFDIKPEKVIRDKSSCCHPLLNNSFEFPRLELCEDFMELDVLKGLEKSTETYNNGSEEDPSDDIYSIDSSELSTAGDDPGEGTSSGAENWKDDDVDMIDDYTHMDSSGDVMDCMPPNDSVLSPPASNERADSNNSMYHRLPCGPQSVGDSGALNKIYPTPPSLLQVDICSPAAIGGPHSQAMKEDKDDASSESSDGEASMSKYLNEIDEMEKKDMIDTKGDHIISQIHCGLSTKKFFDHEPKADAPVSYCFGSQQRRPRVPSKMEIQVYNKKDGEKKDEIPSHHLDALTALDKFTSRRSVRPTSTVPNPVVGGQSLLQQQQLHPSMAVNQQHHLQSQPGPSSIIPPPHPSQIAQMQQHPAYMGGATGPGTGQIPGYPIQPGGMRYPGAYGAMPPHPMQPGFPHQQSPLPMGGGQMMMGQQMQHNFIPGVQMRAPSYSYPHGTVAPIGGGHPSIPTPGMPHQMGYPPGMQNQMMYRPAIPQGLHPQHQFNQQMGPMMPNPMGGMQMGQYGGQMQPQGMMMPQGQTMIAGAPHPMGMSAMPSHPSYMSTPPLPPPPAASVIVIGTHKKSAVTSPAKPKRNEFALTKYHIDSLMAARRGKDPYVHSLSIAPRSTFYRGNAQLRNEFNYYTTELLMEKEKKKGDRAIFAPIGGTEGLSIVAVVMLQDTILNLHFDWVFDSCPICACTTSIRSRELGMYIKPPRCLQESLQAQNEWIGPWNGFHSDSMDTSCLCGFSVIRHRHLSMKSGLFLEDSIEATGDLESGTNPIEGMKKFTYVWFDPSSSIDKAMMEVLRTIALTVDIGRFICTINSFRFTDRDKNGRRKKKEEVIGTIGTPRVEYVVSQMDQIDLLLMGNCALATAHLSGNALNPPKYGQSPLFHPWGLQIASDMADPTEMEIKNLLEDVKPLIEGAVREARKLSSSSSMSVIEGPLTWKALAAKNIKSIANGDDESHTPEPIPYIEMSTEKDAIRVAPTVIKNWEHLNLGPIDVPKDVLYLTVCPDDDDLYDMTVVYMRRLSKMYEQNLRLGRHVGYLVRDDTTRAPVREGIVRAKSMVRTQFPQYGMPILPPPSPALDFIRNIEKFATKLGCCKEFTEMLMGYIQCVEDVLFEHLSPNRIYDRDAFRECVGYALYNKKMYLKQKGNNPKATRHEHDTEDGSPTAPPEEKKKEEGEKKKESQMFKGALAEAMGMAGSSASSSGNEKKKANRQYGHSPPYGMDEGQRGFKQPPDEEPGALPQTVVIYLPLWPCWGGDGRSGEAARVTTISIVKAFNAVMKRLRPKQRVACQLELIPIQRIAEAVGAGADLDRLDRSANLNTWQLISMARNGEVYPTDRPRMEDILKEVALGVYRKPRFLHCDSLKKSLPKSMTKFGPASSTLDWIDNKEGKKKSIYRCNSVPFQLAQTPSIVAKNEGKNGHQHARLQYSSLCLEEVSLYFSYCLVSTHFIVVTLTDNLGVRHDSAVLNLTPKENETASKFRSHNKTSIRDGLDKLWKFIEGIMLNETKPLRLVIGKLGKMGHGEFKAWCHVLSRSNLKKYSSRVKEVCTPCSANAGAPLLLSACLVSTEPEAHLQVLPSFSIPPDVSGGQQKKIRPLHTPGDNTVTHIMVFPISTAIQLTGSGGDMGGLEDDGDDFGELDVPDLGLGGDGMDDIMNELMTGDGEGGERAAARNQHMNSFFDGALEAGVQNQPLAAGWMISTAPGSELPTWFWSSCPSLKRRMPVHLRSSLHINEAQLTRSDDIMKKEKEQESSHALDSLKTDDVLRHVLEQYNDLSWLAIDPITQERKSCLPIHIQALTRLHDAVVNLIL